MFFQLTKKEKQHIADIQKKYADTLSELGRRAREEKGNRREIILEQIAVHSEIDNQIRQYIDDIQKSHFEKTKKNGKPSILENAYKQAPIALDREYEAVKQSFSDGSYKTDFIKEQLEALNVGTMENGQIVLFVNYAVAFLTEEFKLHADALANDPEALQELKQILYEAADRPYVKIPSHIKNVSSMFTPISYSIKNKRLPDILKFHIMNDMTALNLVKYDADIDGQLTLMWEVDDTKTEPVAVSLSYDNPNIAYTKKLTEFDKDIIDAVSTLFYHWENVPENKNLPACPPLILTPAHIWRTMNGKDINDHMARPSARQIQRICDSMDKLRTTLISIDYIKDLRESGFNVNPGMDRTRQSYMIKADKDIEKKNTGKNSIVYIVSEAPFLYRYNKQKGHVLLVDYKLLNITGIESKAKKNTTEYMQEFKSYLLRRITLMRRGILSNKHIKLDTIYTETDTKEPARRIKREDYANEATYKQQIRAEKRRDCDTIRHILGEWVNQGFIKGFTEDKEGRGGAVTGFCIDYDIEPIGEKANAILEDKKATKKTKKK